MARVDELDDAAGFLAATQSLRSEDPVQTNLLGAVAEGVRAGRQYEGYRWLVLSDDSGTVVGAALRTAPYNLVVSPMPPPAADALGRHMAAVDPAVPGITGPREVVDRVVACLPSAASVRVLMTDVLRVLGTYRPPDPWPPGTARPIDEPDRALLSDWLVAFARDAGLPARDPESIIDFALQSGSMTLWVLDGIPVALAGHAPLVTTPSGTVARIGPVYTPHDLRGRGYGSAVTAAMVESLLPRSTTIMLFADALNPGSNRIYERLGFEFRATHVEVALSPDTVQ